MNFKQGLEDQDQQKITTCSSPTHQQRGWLENKFDSDLIRGGSASASASAGEEEERREHMFDKVVTPSDVGKLNRLVIPKQHAEKYFPLDSEEKKGLLLNFEDRNGKPWRFRYSYWNSSQSYVMTKGWSRFVKDKKLDAGDIVSFHRTIKDPPRLFIDWRRRPMVPNHTDHLHHLQCFPQHYFSYNNNSSRSRPPMNPWSPLFLNSQPSQPLPDYQQFHQYTPTNPPPPHQLLHYPTTSTTSYNNNTICNYGNMNNGSGVNNPPYYWSREGGGPHQPMEWEGRGRGRGMMVHMQKVEPLVLDSTVVVVQSNPNPKPKPLRLFGVNMEYCPIPHQQQQDQPNPNPNHDDDNMITTTGPPHDHSNSTPVLVQSSFYNGTPLLPTPFPKAKTSSSSSSMSLDFYI